MYYNVMSIGNRAIAEHKECRILFHDPCVQSFSYEFYCNIFICICVHVKVKLMLCLNFFTTNISGSIMQMHAEVDIIKHSL